MQYLSSHFAFCKEAEKNVKFVTENDKLNQRVIDLVRLQVSAAPGPVMKE